MPLGGKAKALRRLIWSFTRDPDTGLPSATLSANGQWHPRLLMATKEHVAALLDGVNSEVGRIGYVARRPGQRLEGASASLVGQWFPGNDPIAAAECERVFTAMSKV